MAVALHVGEAAYAYRPRAGPGLTGSAPRWGLQTLAVGFPSLGALRAVIRRDFARRTEDGNELRPRGVP